MCSGRLRAGLGFPHLVHLRVRGGLCCLHFTPLFDRWQVQPFARAIVYYLSLATFMLSWCIHDSECKSFCPNGLRPKR